MEIEQFLMFAQCLPVPAVLIDREHRLVAANSVAQPMLGLDKACANGQPLADYVKETPAEVAAYLQACSSAERPLVGTLTCRSGDVRMLCYARPLDPGAPDTLTLLCCTPAAAKSKEVDHFGLQMETLQQEIVRREKIEAELAATEARAQAVLDTAAEGIITIDRHGIIQSFNQAAERIFGYLAKEVIGANVACLMPQPYRSEHDHYIRHYLDTGEKKIIGIGRRVTGRRKEGRTFPMELAVSEVIAGGERHFTGIVRDVSEQVEAEEEARQHRERLAHFDRVSTMGEMASGIAHEINQPLTAISSYAHACYRLIENSTADTADLLAVLDKISAQALRAGEVIHNLRRFVKKRESQRELCDLNKLVRSAVALAETDAREHNFVIETAFSDNTLPVIVDMIQIQQVVINLIRNAVEAMANVAAPNDVVTVNVSTAQDDPTTAQVAVQDKGVGVTEAHADKLFDPFFTTKETGTGIGLAISRTIITAHGGRLWFEHNPDSGVTMHFTLPLASDSSYD